jgi:thiol-disulfide isomerase/thioredoxin
MRATLIFLAMAALICAAACGIAKGRYDGQPMNAGGGGPAGDDDSPQVANYEWTDADGKQIHLYDYLGKVVLLDVAAFWCVNCEAEAPSLQHDIWEPLQGQDFELIQLVVQDADFNPATQQTAAEWRNQFDLTYEVCADPQWSLKQYLTNNELPFLMLLDKTFQIRMKTNDYNASGVMAIIKEYL